MGDRKEVETLMKSRRGFKASVTRIRNIATREIDIADGRDEPILLEEYIGEWQTAIQKYIAAEERVMAADKYEDGDADTGAEDQQDAYLQAKASVRGLRQEYDQRQRRQQQQQQQQALQQAPPQGGQAQVAQPPRLPNLVIEKPQTLEEDTDLITWLRWKPLWANFAQLIKLEERDRPTQVGMFWQTLSPGFQNMIKHQLGIPQDTGRTLEDIHTRIEEHLRSLRNRQLDLQQLLKIRQKHDQEYISLCSEILELADYARTRDLTFEQLHIGILILAMRREDDRAKLINEEPADFNAARAFILNLETARKASKAITRENPKSEQAAHGIRRSAYKKQKAQGGKPEVPTPAPQGPSTQGKTADKCYHCGKTREKHPKMKFCRGPRTGDAKGDEKLKKQVGGILKKVGSIKTSARRPQPCPKPGMVVAAVQTETNTLNISITKEGETKWHKIEAIPDTGAGVAVMGTETFNKSGLRTLGPKMNLNIISVDGRSLMQRGAIKTRVKTGTSFAKVRVAVCDNVDGFYLDMKTCKRLRIIHEEFPQPMRKCCGIGQMPIWDLSKSKNCRDAPVETQDSTADDWPPAEVWPNREEWLSTLPDDGTDDEIAEANQKMREKYAQVFDDTVELKKMRGPGVGDPMKITLKKDSQPYAMHGVRPWAYALREKGKDCLDYMEKRDIIEKVMGDEPSTWLHPVVLAPKPGGDVRFTTDLTRLNSQCERVSHHTKTPAEAISGFDKKMKYFCKLDLTKGYWQLAIDPESRPLTTFATPFGRYRWLRAPMGYLSTGDSYTMRGDVALEGLDIQKVVDDIGGGKPTFRELCRLACEVLERCAKHNLTVSPKKSILVAKKISFVGYNISQDSIEADGTKISSIRDFPTPENITDLRSFMGLVNQLGSFSSTVAQVSSGLRDLLSKKNLFQWLPEHQKCFEDTKKTLCEPPILAMYDPKWQTAVETDASRKGLGFCLRQRPDTGVDVKKEDPENPWRLITSGSRFLTPAESRYAMIELEALAMHWAVKKCRVYLAGMDNFTVFVDHAPLKPWFNDYDLNSVENPRVQRYKMKLQEYRFRVEWRSGKNPGQHAIPDALSRAPTTDPEEDDVDEEALDTAYVRAIITNKHTTCPDMAVEAIAKAGQENKDYQRLIRAVQSHTSQLVALRAEGFQNSYLAQFSKVFDELSVLDNVVLKGSQMVIPNTVKK